VFVQAVEHGRRVKSQYKPSLSNLKGSIPPGIDEGVMGSESDGGSRGRFRRVEVGDLEI
jgi:hypothetical protein